MREISRETLMHGVQSLDQYKTGVLRAFERLTRADQEFFIELLLSTTDFDVFRKVLYADSGWITAYLRMFAYAGLKQILVDHIDVTGEGPRNREVLLAEGEDLDNV